MSPNISGKMDKDQLETHLKMLTDAVYYRPGSTISPYPFSI